jgi:prepilin-type N-terminal cleavage/methylation domain-containing protein
MKKITHFEFGFTLIELLITIGIMTLLIAVAVPSYNKYGRYNELTQIAETVKSAILTAKNDALAPTNKTSGVAYYAISFKQDPAGYTIFESDENGKPISTDTLDSATFNNYTLSFQPESLSTIVFSIVDKGKIVLPQISGSTGIITITSNRIDPPDNQIILNINTLTGQVETQQ